MICFFLLLIYLSLPAFCLTRNTTVVILGGGVAGVIAARTLHENGIDDFIVVEARDEFGGRMQIHNLSGIIVERGPNWIQGTQEGDGPANPILTLAQKWNVSTQFNDIYGSITTYDDTGAVDYLDVFNKSVDDLVDLTIAAGERVANSVVDTTARTGYSIIGVKPRSPHEQASEYLQYDWEYAQPPEDSSWIASSWNNNFTYVPEEGGFADENLLSIDQRGFKTLIQLEAQSFLQPSQVLLQSIVKSINYSSDGVSVTLDNNDTINAQYAISTFSLGVLQNDDVEFIPPLPAFKQEAIQSMAMSTYTKIFLKFPTKFWFDTEMGLYADKERGRYPVWQSLDHDGFLPGSGVVFVTVTGDFSVRIEAMSDDQVQAEVLSVLQTMFPNTTIPDPIDFYFPRWHQDPLFRGSYSNWPASFFGQHHENLRANVSRLYFSGEALSEKYFGFLHGAYFEGQSIAAVVVGCINSGGDDCGLPHVDAVTNGLTGMPE